MKMRYKTDGIFETWYSKTDKHKILFDKCNILNIDNVFEVEVVKYGERSFKIRIAGTGCLIIGQGKILEIGNVE